MADKKYEYRKVKSQMFKRILQPAGFVKGRYLYIRHAGNQVHGIEFQGSKYGGGDYFVNIAFHYDFLPPSFEITQGKMAIPFEKYRTLDFILFTRIERLMSQEGYPWKWNYVVATQLETTIDEIMRDSLKAIDELSAKWRDPRVLLELLSPDVIILDQQLAIERSGIREEERAMLPPSPIWKALRFWALPVYVTLAYQLAMIAVHCGERTLAETYLRIVESEAKYPWEHAFVMDLKSRIASI